VPDERDRRGEDSVGVGQVSSPASLADRWRADASVLRRRGAVTLAELLDGCAAELEAWERERALELLTLEQASAESGYTYSAIEKMLRRGELVNLGKKGTPRVRRGDLPRKAVKVSGAPDLAGSVLQAQQSAGPLARIK
jgi:hypothetical protein